MRSMRSWRLACALAIAVSLGATVASAGVPTERSPPERLLAENSVAYWRFDGWEPHQAAYDKTALAETMREDLGVFLDYLSRLILNEYSSGELRDSLLAGNSPEDLAKLRRATKQVPVVWDALCKHGVVAGIEIVGPSLNVRTTAVFPQGKSLYSVARVLGGQLASPAQERMIKDRSVLISETKEQPMRVLAWAEGDDLVLCASAEPAEQLVQSVVDRGERNLIDNPVYQRLVGFKEYETQSQGFVDIRRAIAAVSESPFGALAPRILASVGLGNVQQFAWHTGFAGRHHRSAFELILPGERAGVLKLLAGQVAFRSSEILPLPPDASYVQVLNISLAGFYEGFRETAQGAAALLGDDAVKQVRALEDLSRDTAKRLGIDIKTDFLGALGSTMVVYAAPSEGPLSIGAGVAVQVIHPDKLRSVLDAAGRAAVSQAGEGARIKRRMYRGAEVVTLLLNGEAFPFMPSYTIHKGWLVLALNPQTVEGYIMRAEGRCDAWRPSPLLTEVVEGVKQRSTRAKIIAVSESDPRPGLRLLLSFAPLIGNFLGSAAPDKFDNSMIPNVQSVVAPLYPSVSVLVDDGESLRLDNYMSAPFPFDGSLLTLYMGLEIVSGDFTFF